MKPLVIGIVCLALTCYSNAQQSGTHATAQSEGTDMQSMPMGTNSEMPMRPQSFEREITDSDSSGTSAQPNSTPSPMLMDIARGWKLMFHANVFAVDEQQSQPARRRPLLLDQLVHGHGAARRGPGHLHRRAPC